MAVHCNISQIITVLESPVLKLPYPIMQLHMFKILAVIERMRSYVHD